MNRCRIWVEPREIASRPMGERLFLLDKKGVVELTNDGGTETGTSKDLRSTWAGYERVCCPVTCHKPKED